MELSDQKSFANQAAKSGNSSANLGLGANAVGELAELINWTNSQAHKTPSLKPWAYTEGTLDPKLTEAATEENLTEESNAITEVASQVEEPTFSITNEQSIVFTEVMEESSSTNREALDEALLAQDAKPSDDSNTERQRITSSETMEPGDAGVDHDLLAPAQESVILDETVTQSVSHNHHDSPVQSIVSPATTEPEPELASAELDAKSGSTHDMRRASKTRQPTDSTVPSIASLSPKNSSMTNRLNMNEQGDDYLRRLETLVLELNLELARNSHIGDDSAADPTQWLRKRVIDLSLQNMALQEELSKQQ